MLTERKLLEAPLAKALKSGCRFEQIVKDLFQNPGLDCALNRGSESVPTCVLNWKKINKVVFNGILKGDFYLTEATIKQLARGESEEVAERVVYALLQAHRSGDYT
jgi:hypothetical protein